MLLKLPSQANSNSPTSDVNNCIKVLAIENDEDDRYLLTKMLEQDPGKYYELETTDILQAGIDILHKREFDVILLDLGLNESEGIETLRLLLNQKFTIPVIVLTGNNQSVLGEQAIKEGAEDFIPKFEVSTSLISRAISYAIERYRLVVQLQNQALTDQLTMLPNRTAVYERLDSLIYDSERRAIRFGIGLLDLDDFKSVNDNLGHRAGDDLLRQIASRLQKSLRKSDMVARLGGDEFIVVVTHYHNQQEFLDVLNKKQDNLRKKISLYANKQVHEISLSASIGACEWQTPLNAQQLISLADKAMYESKKRQNGEVIIANSMVDTTNKSDTTI